MTSAPTRRRFRITRDSILFAFGLAGIIYETVVHNGDNPSLLVLFGAMCGLPAFLRSDEALTSRAQHQLEESAKPASETEESP